MLIRCGVPTQFFVAIISGTDLGCGWGFVVEMKPQPSLKNSLANLRFG